MGQDAAMDSDDRPKNTVATIIFAGLRARRHQVLRTVLWTVVSAGGAAAIAYGVGPALSAVRAGVATAFEAEFGLPHGVNTPAVGTVIALLIGMVVLRGWAEYRARLGGAALQQALVHDVRVGLFSSLLRSHHRWGKPLPRGVLGARINQEIHGIRALLGITLIGVFPQLVVATALASLALGLDTRLATLGLLALPVVVWVTVRVGKATRVHQGQVYDAEARMLESTVQTADRLEVIRAYNAEPHVLSRLAQVSERCAQSATDAEALQGRSPMWLSLAGAACVGLVLLGATAWIEPSSEAVLISLVVALLWMFRPLSAIATSVYAIAAGLTAADRLNALLTEPPPSPRPRKHAVDRVSTIKATDLTFGYTLPLLEGVGFEAHAGQCVAITGSNGAGKSTCLKLLAGLLEAQGGEILVDGVPAKRAGAYCAWMPDDAQLMTATIVDNIALGHLQIDADRLNQASRLADADLFIDALPQGYAHVVERGGATLSTGQRKRIALARAFYRQAPVLLLDEPTAGLDAAAQAHICQALRRWADDGGIVIVATHRPAVIAMTDRVYAIVDKRLVQVGEDSAATLRGQA